MADDTGPDAAPATAVVTPGGAGRLLAALALVLPVLTAVVVLAPGAGAGSAAAGAVLLGGALVAAWGAARVPAQVAATLAAGLGAGVCALGVLGDHPAGAGHVAVAAAGLGAAGSAVLGPRGTPEARRVARTVVVSGLLTTGGALLTLLAALPLGVLAVAAVAVSVPVARVLPDVVVDVADGTLVNLDRLATTAWSPRPRRLGRRPGPVDRGALGAEVRAAATHQRVVLAAMTAAVVLAGAVVAARPPGGPWAGTALLATAGCGLALVARRYHGRTDRWLLRGGALAAVAAGWLVVPTAVPDGMTWLLAVGPVVVATVLVLASPVVGRGWKSLALGRLADVTEALCVAATLPLAVWAAGLIPWIRALVA